MSLRKTVTCQFRVTRLDYVESRNHAMISNFKWKNLTSLSLERSLKKHIEQMYRARWCLTVSLIAFNNKGGGGGEVVIPDKGYIGMVMLVWKRDDFSRKWEMFFTRLDIRYFVFCLPFSNIYAKERHFWAAIYSYIWYLLPIKTKSSSLSIKRDVTQFLNDSQGFVTQYNRSLKCSE